MRLGIDMMGGDFAPESTIQGAVLARKELPGDIELLLVGNQGKYQEIINREGYDTKGLTCIHTSQRIEMGENPVRAFSAKANSSMRLGLKMLKNEEIDGFASAGNTGAMLLGASRIVNAIPGVIRPCITAGIPNEFDTYTIILDVGLNPDSRPDVLYQYGIMGSIYAELVYNIENPRVGLLNIGAEEEKGNLLTRATYQIMKGTKDFNFIGNIEGTDLFSENKADVVICDGFVGNVVIKEIEGFYKMLRNRNIRNDFFNRFNFENYGGTAILGILKPVVIGHGISNGVAIKNMILHTRDVIETNLTEKFKTYFNNE